MSPEPSAEEPPVDRTGPIRWPAPASVVLLLGLATLVAGVWWWSRPAQLKPPMPENIADAPTQQAIERARKKVLDAPRSADNWGELGMLFLASLFDREADTCFAEAARLNPNDARWPYGRGLIAVKRDQEHALLHLRQAAAAAASWPEGASTLRMQLADTLYAQGHEEQAEGLYRDELRRQPNNARAAWGLALVALARGNERDAKNFLLIARKSPFAKKKANAKLAALTVPGDGGEASADYEKLAASLPADAPWPDPFLDEILTYQVGHRHSERQIAELERAGRYQDAANFYMLQIQENPTSSEAHVGAGINLARLRDYVEALPLLHRGIDLDPQSANAHYTLALAQYTRAELELGKSPNSPAAKDWLREAVEHARRATELKPDHASAFLFWGLSLMKLGDPAAALAPLRAGAACRPEFFDLQMALGETLMQMGDDSQATVHLQNAQSLEPNDPRPAQLLEAIRRKKS
jgi:tetratricopeptide (TPR) repeat protein